MLFNRVALAVNFLEVRVTVYLFWVDCSFPQSNFHEKYLMCYQALFHETSETDAVICAVNKMNY